MTSFDVNRHFLAIWRRALNEPSLESLTTDQVRSWANDKGLDVVSVEERDAGTFAPTKSIVLTLGCAQACFPKVPAAGDAEWKARRLAADRTAALWEKMEWFSPLWVPSNSFGQLLQETATCSKERAVQLFDYHTSTVYTIPFQAVCIAQIMPQARSLQEFAPLAREAFLAFFSGYRASSISALIPAIEGSLARIVSSVGTDLQIHEKVNGAVDGAIEYAAQLHFDQMWAPREYLTTEYLFGQDERVFIFETFRRWLQRSFFRNTGEYDGATWLNRHLFAHGNSSLWQQSANFSRLVVALTTVGAIESWHDQSNRVSLFFPEMNDDGKLLWQQALFQATAQSRLKLIEQETYQKHGRLVPEMPTDNGALLRKAKLSDDCIKDLVRPLREAGWSVAVGEPDEDGLYMTAVATAEGAQLRVALLFSCATDNQIYRKLAESCDAILYREAPYHQDQFAYGVTVHVGPVAGWHPPPAPSQRRSTNVVGKSSIANWLKNRLLVQLRRPNVSDSADDAT